MNTPPPSSEPWSVPLDLIRKYNTQGPRYTSYPPANHFVPAPGPEAILERLEANRSEAGDLSIYVHLPFCRSRCWFCGCTTVITTEQRKSAQYLGYVRRELNLVAPLLAPARKVVQLHFGGGTPTFFLPDEIRTLSEWLRDQFQFAADLEAGVEIDPRGLTLDHVRALREAGFNRASIGVQDLNPEVQRAVHRIQPIEMARRAIGWARQEGFNSINLDLIYGLPFQTADSFAATLDEVLGLRPDRLAVFNYAHVPWIKPAQRIIKPETLPSAETKLEILKRTIESLTAAGFEYIGMDHFARAGDELAVAQRQGTLQRNFQGYSTRGGAEIYGLGMSSISQADGAYWQNEKEMPEYYRQLDQGRLPVHKSCFLTGDDRIRRHTIMRLMCDLDLEYGEVSARFGIRFAEYFAAELDSLADLEADGLLRRHSDRLKITPPGRLLIRNIAMRFDAYLKPSNATQYSKTI